LVFFCRPLFFLASSFGEFLESVDEIFIEIRNCLTPWFLSAEEFFEFPKMNRNRYKNEPSKEELLVLLVTKVLEWILEN
jgi:hypothetical protein